MTPHVAQLSPEGMLFIAFGVAENGFGFVVVDTKTGETKLVEGDRDEPRLFVSTGDFDVGYTKWYFASWPTTNSRRDDDKIHPNRFEIRSVDLETFEQKILYVVEDDLMDGQVKGIGLPRRLHQVTVSDDGRYAVCSPFDYDPKIPYPDVSIEEDPEGYRRTHQGGMKLEYLITIDLLNRKHWFTEVPVPVPAHIEFDPADQRVIYASAHNIAATSIGTVLEGPATLFKFRILEDRTEIVGSYSDPGFFRITQHSVFRHDGRTLVGVTSVPNRLVILDAESMTLWRDVILFDAEPLVLSGSGALSPEYANACYSLNPSFDERYIVLENAKEFVIYDLVDDKLLSETAPRSIPAGYMGRGHTRTLGQ